MEEKKELLSLLPDELAALLTALGEPRYRAEQIFSQLHKGLSPDEMTNISKLTLNDVVKEIGAIAFNGTYIAGELFIPKTVTKLGDDAFSATPISKVTFEDASTLEEIGAGLFFSCNNLTEIPDGIPYISAAMFQQCRGLTNITIPSSVKSIGEFAFNECPNLLPVHIPNNVEKIHGNSFALSSVKSCFASAFV